jgi:2-dehydro-3-deoxygluconokinase
MSDQPLKWDVTKDDLSEFTHKGPAFVTFGETMLRDTPADMQRAEMANLVHIAFAGSEYTLAMLLARFGIPSAYITRVPDNPYGWLLRDTARGQGMNTDHFVWEYRSFCLGAESRTDWTIYL